MWNISPDDAHSSFSDTNSDTDLHGANFISRSKSFSAATQKYPHSKVPSVSADVCQAQCDYTHWRLQLLFSPASTPLSACGGCKLLPSLSAESALRRLCGAQTVFTAAKILLRCLKWDDVAVCKGSRKQADGFRVERTSLRITQADCLQGLRTQIHQSAPEIICPRNLKWLPILNEISGSIQPGLRGNISYLNL